MEKFKEKHEGNKKQTTGSDKINKRTQLYAKHTWTRLFLHNDLH
jgi:hypothetical protein